MIGEDTSASLRSDPPFRPTLGASSSYRPYVFHVSGEFPDPYDYSKTRVIQTLLDLTSNSFDHEVLSLNRANPDLARFSSELIRNLGRPSLHLAEQQFEYGTAIRYEAPPKGIYHLTMLSHVADWLLDKLQHGKRPDLIIGHKLTIEGHIAARVAQKLAIPYAISIQGDTDTRILSVRRDLRSTFAKIFHDASVVFPFSPWALDACTRDMGSRDGSVQVLPCPTELDEPLMPKANGNGLLTVFHLKSWRRKNLRGMAAAMESLNRAGTPARLAVVGGGTQEDRATCERTAGGVEGLEFEGPLSRGEIRSRMNAATGFLLPSRRESFGLVFLEALFAGLPVIYPKNFAIDGFFDRCPFAIAVDAANVREIAAAMQYVIENEQFLKDRLAHWLDSPASKQFKRPEIGRMFEEGMTAALSAKYRPHAIQK